MILKGAKDIGAYIGMSVPTFHRHKDKDGIPYFRAGHNICARSEDLSEWIGRQIRKEEKHDRRKEKASDTADDLRDDVAVPQLREETPSVPRQLQRVRPVPQKITTNQGRTVRR